MLFDNVILGALVIFLVRALSIALSTLRYLTMAKSAKLRVSSLAFIEALAFALTFGQVAQNLENLWNLGAYCLGFSAGTWVGMLIEERVGQGYATINIVSMGKSLPVAEAIREAGFGATRSSGEGTSGTVGLVRTVTRRRDASQVIGIAQDVDSKAFVTVEETRSVSRGFLGHGR
jgi:uncharacterized protein YebE (UPF0316 family)